MKNLKKAFAVVIALTMVMSTVAFAAVFSDVADTDSFAEAIEFGVAVKMFTGYEDGTFKPEGDITRAEFAAIVVRMLGQEAQADGAKGITKFDDVPSTHWASGYINIVSNLGIVNGYGDGNFGPEDNVTYEQAVKMCVVALGYEPAAGGNYPVGYLTIAQQRGLTTGVKGTSGVPINRGQVAQMAFNALDVPLMTQTGFGTYIEYVINDGTNNTDRKTLLTENLGIVKIKAMVKESYDLSSARKEGLVKVEVKNAYRSAYGEKGERFEVDTDVDIAAGDSKLKSFVGYPVIAYVYYDEASDDYPVAVYVRKDLSNTEELEVFSSDLEWDPSDDPNDFHQLSYWPSSNARTPEKFTVKKNPDIYVNGELVSNSLSNVLNKFYGKATFARNYTDTDEDYDTVYVLDYKNVVVESVNLTAGRVVTKESSIITTLSFNESNTNISSVLYDEDGNELEWSVLQENDILSVRTAGAQRKVNICTLVRNTVTGVITEKTNAHGDEDVEFKIGGEYYKVDNLIVAADDLDLQYEGTFYLDIFGRIAYYEADSSLSSNYAYIIQTGIHEVDFGERLQIKAFTFDGEIVTLTCATRVTLVEEVANNKTETTTYRDGSTDNFTKLEGKLDEGSVITFSVNDRGEVNRIALPGNNSDVGLNYFSKFAEDSTFDYRGKNADTATLMVNKKSVEISDNTIIMIAAPLGDDFTEDDYDLLSLSVLGAEDIEQDVKTTVYDVNKNMVAGLVVVEGRIDVVGESEGLAMVAGVSKQRDDNGAQIDVLTVLRGGEKSQISVSEIADTPDPFSIINPKLNAKGMMSAFDEVITINDKTGVITKGDKFVDTDDVQYVMGTPVAVRSNRVTLQYQDESGDEVEQLWSIPSSANVYLYDQNIRTTSLKAKIVDSINVFDVAKTDIDENTVEYEYFDEFGDVIDSVHVMLRWYDGRIQDVFIFFNTTVAAQ